MEKVKDIAKSLGYRLINEITINPENKLRIKD
jgi:hypothetical protein